MAATSSFDITSTIDLQEVDNALNQARKELATRFDFKGAQTEILHEKDKIVLTADDASHLKGLREIVKFIKDQKLKKVQAAIQADQVRVSAPAKDDLQEAMRQLREHDFGVALQFGNYR